MKPHPPVLRDRRRYIVFEVLSEEKFSKKDIMRTLWDNAFEWIGVLGASEASFWVIDFDEKQQIGFLRCNNENLEKVRAILGFIEKVNNKKGCFHIISVTGTVKKARSLGLIVPKD